MRVSVVIPAYNAEHSIRSTLDSVLDQDFESVQVLVVDDGSSDKTADIVQAEYPSVELLKQENQGQGQARNAGLESAIGEFVAFLDADDYWKPGFLDATTSFLDRQTNAIAVSTAFLIKTTKGEYVGPANIEWADASGSDGWMLENFFEFWGENDHIRTGTVLIRRRLIETVGHQLADLRISQDLEYWGFLATFGEWGLLPHVLWVGDSARNAVKTGWQKKYKIRRANCPDVEAWERRIGPRLEPHQLAGFEKVRGRVAASYAQNKLLAGDGAGALHIVRKYGDSLPKNKLTSLLKWGAGNEAFRWRNCHVGSTLERLVEGQWHRLAGANCASVCHGIFFRLYLRSKNMRSTPRIAWVTRSFLDYRIPVFEELSKLIKGDLFLVYSGEYVPDSVCRKAQEALGDNAIPMSGEMKFGLEDRQYMANKNVSIRYQPGISEQLKAIAPDVIVCDGFFKWTLSAILYRLFHRIPVVINYERTHHTERNAQWFRTLYRKLIVKQTDAMNCSGRLCVEYSQSLGMSPAKITNWTYECGH